MSWADLRAPRRVMTGFPVPAQSRVKAVDAYRDQACTRWFMQHVREVVPTAAVPRGEGPVWELPAAPRDLDQVKVRRGDGGSWPLAAMLSACDVDAAIVLKSGEVVYECYRDGMTAATPHLYQSVSKSVGACVAARLIDRGVLRGDTPVTGIVPELEGSGYEGATVRHLLDMQVGVRFSEDYEDDDAEIARLDRLYGFRPSRAADEPGSSYEFATQTVREGEHGRVFHYVSLDLQVLAWVMERAAGTRLPELMSREVWARLGVDHDAYVALDGAGSAQLEGGFCSGSRDLARFGLMICRDGRTPAEQVVPSRFVRDCEERGDREAFRRAALGDERSVPEPAYRGNFWTARFAGHHALMGRGIFGQLLYVDRAADFVMAVFSTWPDFSDDLLYAHQFWAARSLSELLA